MENLTAVEWLVKELFLKDTIYRYNLKVIEQAIEMERNQIIDAINDVSQNNVMYANKIISSISPIEGELFMHNDNLAKQYYNDKFKKDTP